jgi:hypothetical protein
VRPAFPAAWLTLIYGIQHDAEVKVKKGYSWSEQLSIVIKCLAESGELSLVDWVRQVGL